MDLKEEDILGDGINGHWYYASKAKALRRFLPATSYRHVLDVGAGSGFFSKELLRHGMVAEGTCVDPGYQEEREEQVNGKKLRFIRATEVFSQDLFLFMDVLEHVEDDVGLLKAYVSKAEPGSDVFISVPAFQFLWSGHDEFLEHYRRYTIPQLKAVVKDAGLKVISSSYGFGAVFPIAVLRRQFQNITARNTSAQSDLKRHSAPVNGALALLCALERPFQRLNRVAGLSVFCLART